MTKTIGTAVACALAVSSNAATTDKPNIVFILPDDHSIQTNGACGVRTERFTPANFYPVKEWELYDNERDPLQLRNVHEDPACAKTVDELTTEPERLRQPYEPGFDPRAPAEPRTAPKN